MYGRNHGLSVLVRSSREGRPATVRDVLAAGVAVSRAVEPLERAADRLDWYRVPISESGHEVLVRSTMGGPRVGVGNEVQDRLTPLNAAWTTLKGDIARARIAGQVSNAFETAFIRDWSAWLAFYRDHIDDWTALRGTLGEIETRRQLLERWRTALTQAGGTATGQPTEAPPPGFLSPGGALGEGGFNQLTENVGMVAGAMAVMAVAGVIAIVVMEARR